MAKTLVELKSGEVGRVVRIVGGKGATARLAAHGIVPGIVVEKIGNLTGGPVVLKIGQTRVAIGRGLASKVMVEDLISLDEAK
ncbi:MAG: FeoA family protein [bacterium]